MRRQASARTPGRPSGHSAGVSPGGSLQVKSPFAVAMRWGMGLHFPPPACDLQIENRVPGMVGIVQSRPDLTPHIELEKGTDRHEVSA
jgi:hypothetical protein